MKKRLEYHLKQVNDKPGKRSSYFRIPKSKLKYEEEQRLAASTEAVLKAKETEADGRSEEPQAKLKT